MRGGINLHQPLKDLTYAVAPFGAAVLATAVYLLVADTQKADVAIVNQVANPGIVTQDYVTETFEQSTNQANNICHANGKFVKRYNAEYDGLHYNSHVVCAITAGRD